MRASPIVAGTLALLLAGTNPASHACGYDGMAMDLTQAHPGSLDVALALHQAYQDQALARPVPLPGGFGMRRALNMLGKLRNTLATQAPADSFSLLLVESGLWARFTTDDEQLKLTPHLPGPAPGDAVLITGEGTLLALQKGRLSTEQALQLGLIRLDASPVQAESLATRWQAAYP
ncbi:MULTISPECIES: hypothetical protein [unclassified Pseudomonas]|uniref:hypothetical protein n=1 Tax=unclassified Pseudomonas TaxID=196821 RepID=UPI002446BF98|nr:MULTISPECIES: hypothetical protein [unclassified Pseudomonas]MDG9924300.1 hypothetical protein [Pseudomonas sp. GD04045]MDH0033341.1 hypothetical protein [Pseudomonas sp. GD04019]